MPERPRASSSLEHVDRAAEAPSASRTGCAACGASLEANRCAACGAIAEAGGFTVESLLHQSDHSRVYLARSRDGVLVVLKELIFSRAPDAAALEAFEREAALLGQLSHPSIPRFIASFRVGEGPATRLYLAQERIEGRPLSELMRDGRHDEAFALQLLEKALPVLRYLHGLSPPLVHRDLKPQNILVKPDGTIALVDFGSAREIAPSGTYRATMTGTFGYLPPEALGGTLDRTADFYGLGATLVHLLSRKPPEELLWAEQRRPLAASLNVSARFAALLERMTARDRAARVQSVDELGAALRSVTHEPRAASGRADLAVSDEQRAERRTRRAVLILGCAVALLSGANSQASALWLPAALMLAYGEGGDVSLGQRAFFGLLFSSVGFLLGKLVATAVSALFGLFSR